MGLDKMSTYAFKLIGRVQDGDLYGVWKFLRGSSCLRDITNDSFCRHCDHRLYGRESARVLRLRPRTDAAGRRLLALRGYWIESLVVD